MTTMRSVAVQRLSFHQELTNVVRSSALVVVAVWMYLAATAGSGGDARRSLLPYQTLVQNRPAADQRLFRELQEGLLEAEATRSAAGEWPAVDVLAEAGIPPFAPDPTAKQAVYRWQLIRDGAFVNYLGIPDREGAPAWMLLIQEPQPGIPPDQTFEDEEHHKLLDGSMLHISTWAREDGIKVVPRLTTVPQAEGWMQLYAVGPGVTDRPVPNR
jgi:hypothetical protein